jgi:hypothetical protein
MIKDFSESTRVPAKKINTGRKVIKANCQNCRKQVIADKTDDGWRCPNCNAAAQQIPGEREFTKPAGCFIFPAEITASGIFPKGTTSIRVMPAHPTIQQTIPHSYTRWAGPKQRFCTSRDGETAERHDKATGKKKPYPCSPECSEKKSGACKANATFYVRLVDTDTLSIYAISTSSEQSIKNIISALNQLSRFTRDGKIPTTAECTLTIAMKKSEKYAKEYQQLKSEQDPSAKRLDWQPPQQPGHQGIPPQGQAGTECKPPKQPAQSQGDPPNADTSEQQRIQKGRTMVKQKARELTNGQATDEAVEQYARHAYNRAAYDNLTLAELTDLWHRLTRDPAAIAAIKDIANTPSRQTPDALQHA